MTQHSYLVEEGAWHSQGTYVDEHGEKIPAEGKVSIIHHDDVWRYETLITLQSDPSVELSNRYEITPIGEGMTASRWTSQHSKYGVLKGTFVFVGTSIHSTYESGDGTYRGVESMTQIDGNTYEVSGSLLRGGKRVFSWMMDVWRIDE